MNMFKHRWVFYRAKLMTSGDTNRLLSIMNRAAAGGWNGIMLKESGCLKDATPNTTCMANLEKIKVAAQTLRLNLVPVSFSQAEPVKGQASVDLREAFPVKETKFIVRSGRATAVGDPAPALVNGGFETLSGWSVDLPGTVTLIDAAQKHSGTSSIRITNPAQNPNGNKARIYQPVRVVPFRAYKLSVWIKTEGFTAPANIGINVLGSNGRPLYQNRDYRLGVAPPASTQTWKQYVIDFNSLEHTSVYVYFVATGNATGRVWFDDAEISEVGLYSMVRRPAAPIVVQSFDRAKTYTEGRDYIVATEALTIPAGSTIANGASLKVSWYQLADSYELWSIPGTAAHQDFYTVLTANARLIASRLPATTHWMMDYNEWRAGAWGTTPLIGGPYLADVIKRSAGIIKTINPAIVPLCWADMFTPDHNQKKQYYGFNGDLAGSHLGFPPGMIAVNWYNNNSTRSLEWWSGLGLPQCIGGYYESKANVVAWLKFLTEGEAKTPPVSKVEHFLYTTWGTGADGGVGKYEDLEGVMKLLVDSGRVPR